MEKFLKLLELWSDRPYSKEADEEFMNHLNSFTVGEIFEIQQNIDALFSLFKTMSSIKGLFMEVWEDL